MNSLELARIISGDKLLNQTFLGVFAADQLTFNPSKRPSCLIANTDPANLPGQHWVAIYFDAHDNVEYFDSYGRHPSSAFASFMKKNAKRMHVYEKRLQSNDTFVCGMYCVYFLYYRVRGIKNMFSRFWQNFIDNDRRICGFMYRKFRVRHNVCY